MTKDIKEAVFLILIISAVFIVFPIIAIVIDRWFSFVFKMLAV
jgi:hypothetical protein